MSLVKFQGRQFYIVVSFAMINKSQGQTLSSVGVYLTRSRFTYGQLYYFFSRVHSREGLKFLLENHENMFENCIINVVYRKVFEYLS